MSYDSTILAESNLVAYYPLNETSGTTATDNSGNGRNGTLHGTITLNQTKLAPGLDPCMLFDGSTGYITLPTGVQVVEPLSIEMWFKPTTLTAGGLVVYGAGYQGTNGYEFGIEGTPTTNFYIDLNAGFTNGGSNFTTNTVYYVAFTVDTSQNTTGYTGPVGGTVTQQITANPGGTLSYPAQGPYIGARNNNPNPVLFFNGNISSVAVYSKLLTTTIMNNHILSASSAGPPPTAPQTIVTAYGRDGKVQATGRDGKAAARGRDGIVQARGH